MEARFSLQEIAESSGIPSRTIRYYIEKGLIPHAKGNGRSAYYTPEHLQALERVAQLRSTGMSLDEIRDTLRSIGQQGRQRRRQHWERITLHDGLEIHVRSDAAEAVQIFLKRIEELAESWFGSQHPEA